MYIGLRHLGLNKSSFNLGANAATANYTTPAGFDNITASDSATGFTCTAGTTASRAFFDVSASAISRTYRVSFRVVSISAGTMFCIGRNAAGGQGINLGQSASVGAGQTVTFDFTVFGTAASVLWVTNNSAVTCTVDQISIRELT